MTVDVANEQTRSVAQDVGDVAAPPVLVPVPYGLSLTLAEAKSVVHAAEEFARERGWPMVIAVVDSACQLILLHRMDQAQLGSIEVSRQKAETAVAFRRPTAVFQEALTQGGIHLRLLGMNNLTPLEGGLPLLRNGAVVGGIGVSGMQSDQDVQVALAGAGAL
ncbi:GlcG/HbpS family heme-binding protein [Paraherbaspirillum soli]|uniref:Heme-binding protein n=1 Tax=Paraherbaspirillum soli TaxID=631222 RepID=A0ABW0M630_9BURK